MNRENSFFFCFKATWDLAIARNGNSIVEVGYWVMGPYGIGQEWGKEAQGRSGARRHRAGTLEDDLENGG